MHWRIFGIIPGLYPLGLSSNFLPVVTVRNAQTLPSIPSRQNHPQAENRGSGSPDEEAQLEVRLSALFVAELR